MLLLVKSRFKKDLGYFNHQDGFLFVMRHLFVSNVSCVLVMLYGILFWGLIGRILWDLEH